MTEHETVRPAVYPAALTAELAAACAPLADPAAAGASLRYTAVYREIRQAREEDDMSLPRGDWERPLKKADWPKVASLCVEALQTRSKDLQIAGWLCEAWVRLHGLSGLAAAVDVLSRLVDDHWDDAQPLPDGDDWEPRIGVFAWLNESLASTLTLHVPLMTLDLPGMATLNLEGWTRCIGSVPAARDANALTRDALVAHACADRLDRLLVMQRDLARAAPGFAAFVRRLDHAMGGQAPSFERTSLALERLGRAIASLLDGRSGRESDPPTDAAPHPAPSSAPHDAGHAANAPAAASRIPSDGPANPTDPAGPAGLDIAPTDEPAVVASRIRDRDHAYALIDAVASYLQRQEPHSPTPYLLMRAASWGRMPLIDLMSDIVREEGDLQRYLAAIGARP